MKATRSLFLLSAFCLSTAGCTQNEFGSDSTGDNGQQVPLNIEAPTLETEVVTRAGTYSTLGAGSSIGVFLDNATGVTAYTKQNNMRYDYGSPLWVPNNASKTVFLKTQDALVCAYYPYSSTVINSAKVDLSPQILDDGKEPLAYATNKTINRVNNTVSFQMNQACYWLVLKFTRGNIKEACTISEIRLENAALSKEYFVNITNGTETKTPADNGRITFTGDIVLAANSTVTRNISLPYADALTGTLKIGVKLKNFGNRLMSVSLPGITSLPKGTKTEVTLTVNGTYIEVASVNIKQGWDDKALTDASGNETLKP